MENQGDGKTQPHQMVFEESPYLAVQIVCALDHRQREPGQWEHQPLVVQPLSAQKHAGAKKRPVEGQQENNPRGKGNQPGSPGNIHSLGQPFVQKANGLAIGRRQPFVNVREKKGIPVILGSGVVDRPGDNAQKAAHQSFGRHHRTGQHHDENHDQFRPGKTQTGSQHLEHGHHRGDQTEQEQNGDDGNGIAGQF